MKKILSFNIIGKLLCHREEPTGRRGDPDKNFNSTRLLRRFAPRNDGKLVLSVFSIIMLLVLTFSVSAFAQTKIDPTFNRLKSAQTRFQQGSVSMMKMANVVQTDGVTLVGSMIKVRDVDLVSKKIEELGGTVKSVLGDIVTAKIPLTSVDGLAELDEVVYIEAGKRLSYKMNVARGSGISDVEQVQTGSGTTAYNGSGVVIGIIDSGVDCTHPDFDDASGDTRIINYWDMGSNKDYTTTEIENGDCYNALDLTESAIYHGTHVAGIAAGKNSTYKGVAPEASIVAVQLPSTAGEDDVLNGITYIFQKAQALLAPAVVNLSLGTAQGAHDGTSTFEQGIDNALSGKEGRSIVVAAGNETVNTNDSDPNHALGGLHASVNVSGGTDRAYEMISRTLTTNNLGIADGYILADIWLDAGSDCEVEIDVYTSEGSGAILIDGTSVAAGSSTAANPDEEGNISAYVDFSDSVNANNGMQHAQAVVEYYLATPYNPLTLTFDVIFRGGSSGCTGDIWMSPDAVSYNVFTGRTSTAHGYTYVSGDDASMTTIPSTAASAISVASFASRGTWTGLKVVGSGSEVYNQDDYADAAYGGTGTASGGLSLYSSHGPGKGTGNVQKPEIAAPGEPIMSTCILGYCSLITGNGKARVAYNDSYQHLKLEGTSMATPLVSGVVAMLFEKNGCLTAAQVKEKLTSNASMSGSPDYEWGYGKMSALDSVLDTTASTCQPDNPDDEPATAKKSGCSIVTGKVSYVGMIVLLLTLTSLFFIKRRRVRCRNK